MANFQIQMKTRSFTNGAKKMIFDISYVDIKQFGKLIKIVNNNKYGEIWNWFGNGLPSNWDGKTYILDKDRITSHMKNIFDWDITDDDINMIHQFYMKFTPFGVDAIIEIKVYKLEEYELYGGN